MAITPEQLDVWERLASETKRGLENTRVTVLMDGTTKVRPHVVANAVSVCTAVPALIAALAEAESKSIAMQVAVDNLTASLAEAIAQRDEAKARAKKYQSLSADLSDKLYGTPCAQIAWEQERVALTSALEKAREALDWIAKFYPGTVPKEKMVEYLIDNYNYNRQRAISALDAIDELLKEGT